MGNRYSPHALRMQVEALFDVVQERSQGDELVFICPECGDRSGNRSVNLKTGKTNCWRCNRGGDFVSWAKHLGYPVEVEEENAPARQDLGKLVAPLDETFKKLGGGSYVSGIALPRGFTPISAEPDGAYARMIGRMARRKHLELDDITAAGAGFTRDDPKWEPFVIFPVVEWGRVVYYQGRTYSEEPGENTKLFPSRREVALGSRHWLYGIDPLRESGGIAVVMEAVLSKISFEKELRRRGIGHVWPIACFKHKISAEQIAKLSIVRGLKEVCLMFDPDAMADAYRECSRLYSYVPVTAVKMPFAYDGRKLDPNDDAALAVDLFRRRSSYSDLAVAMSRLE
jgi:hypothetical protein